MVIGVIIPVAANDIRLKLLNILYITFARGALCKPNVVDVVGAAVGKIHWDTTLVNIVRDLLVNDAFKNDLAAIIWIGKFKAFDFDRCHVLTIYGTKLEKKQSRNGNQQAQYDRRQSDLEQQHDVEYTYINLKVKSARKTSGSPFLEDWCANLEIDGLGFEILWLRLAAKRWHLLFLRLDLKKGADGSTQNITYIGRQKSYETQDLHTGKTSNNQSAASWVSYICKGAPHRNYQSKVEAWEQELWLCLPQVGTKVMPDFRRPPHPTKINLLHPPNSTTNHLKDPLW